MDWRAIYPRGVVTVALGLLAGLLLVPVLTPLLPTPLSQWVAAGLGLLAGAYVSSRWAISADR